MSTQASTPDPRPSDLDYARSLLHRARNHTGLITDADARLAQVALAHAVVELAQAIQAQNGLMAGIKDRMDHMIRQTAQRDPRLRPPPQPPTPMAPKPW